MATSEAIPDGGDEDDRPSRDATWESVGRELLMNEMGDCRFDLEDAFHAVEETLRAGDDVTEEHVRALRSALNEAQERVEEQLAPAAGVGSWGDPKPRIPMGVLWEMTSHPKAEGVDPRDYVDDEEDADE